MDTQNNFQKFCVQAQSQDPEQHKVQLREAQPWLELEKSSTNETLWGPFRQFKQNLIEYSKPENLLEVLKTIRWNASELQGHECRHSDKADETQMSMLYFDALQTRSLVGPG